MTLWTIAGVSGTSAMIEPAKEAVAFFYGHVGLPFLLLVKGIHVDAAADVRAPGLCDLA